jgi:methyl-accepting chemotaxis protein
LEEDFTTVAAYKPGPQARYLVDKMAESMKNIHDALSQLTSLLASIEKKVDNMTVDLGKVREKVNLTMTSIGKLQEEQVLAAKQLKAVSGSMGSMAGAGVMGHEPTLVSLSSVAMNTLPLPPPDRFLQNT